MKIVSNCPLCKEHSLHVIEEDNIGTQQCINCGYATTSNFIGTKEDNEAYKTLTEEMQSWSKEVNDRIWIPSMITLPFGMLYPIDVEEVVGDGSRTIMKWAISEMVDIPDEEQRNYPNPQGGYYDKMYDTDNQKVYDVFIEAMTEMNEKAKDLNMGNEPTISSDNG